MIMIITRVSHVCDLVNDLVSTLSGEYIHVVQPSNE